MRSRQKRIDFASFPIERQGMGTRFRRHDFLPAHRGDIDNVYDAGIADGDIEMARSLIGKMTSGAPLSGASASTRPEAASIAITRPASHAQKRRPVAGSSSKPWGPSDGTSYSFDILLGSRASIATIRAGDAILIKNISVAGS